RRQRDDERDQHRRRQRDRELAEQPPDLALHEEKRDEHRDQRDADREHGEADFLGASSAAFMRSMPASMWRAVFSRTTMASSTTKPVATVIAIRLRLFSEKPSRYITPKVPSSATTVATAGT